MSQFGRTGPEVPISVDGVIQDDLRDLMFGLYILASRTRLRQGHLRGESERPDGHTLNSSESGRTGDPSEATGGIAGIAHCGDIVDEVDVSETFH